jgi:probable F420-dependent oxidoreductase
MPFTDPVGRMREFVLAVRHIHEVFMGQHPMDFHGSYYSHTLLHPMFNPGPIEWPRVPIGLGGVGPRMTELAGELADFYMPHAFTNIAYQQRVTIPAIQRGLSRSGRSRDDIWMFGFLLLAVGDTEEEQDAAMARIRSQIAFYASSPMYREVLDAIGCVDLQPELEQLVKQRRWDELSGLVDDDVVDQFALRGTLEELPARIRDRYGPYYDRAVPYLPVDHVDLDRLRQFATAVMAD